MSSFQQLYEERTNQFYEALRKTKELQSKLTDAQQDTERLRRLDEHVINALNFIEGSQASINDKTGMLVLIGLAEQELEAARDGSGE